MITIEGDFPTGCIINVDDELMRMARCPDCDSDAVERNTPEGWLVFCANGCNGRVLGISATASSEVTSVAVDYLEVL